MNEKNHTRTAKEEKETRTACQAMEKWMLNHMEKCAHQQRRLHEPYIPINVFLYAKKPYQLLSLLKYGIKMRHRSASCGDIDASVCVLMIIVTDLLLLTR